MASINIHEEQENRVPPLRQKQLHVLPHGQKKRSVLGAIENQPQRLLKGKQVLLPHIANTSPHNNICKQGLIQAKVENENIYTKSISNKPTPIVPVAQFEAFKVYEDSNEERIDRELREIQRRRKDKDPFSHIYKGTADDRLVTKKEAMEMLQNERPADVVTVASSASEIEVMFGSPMSIEKVNDENDSQGAIVKSLSTKDLFFEMEEYRSDILLYLREHEVSTYFIIVEIVCSFTVLILHIYDRTKNYL